MSALAEKVLVGLLTDVSSLEALAQEGLDLSCVPTEAVHPIITWALRYYRQSGKAPTPAAVRENESYKNLLSDKEISLHGDPGVAIEESMEWAIDTLKADRVRKEASIFSRNMITDISTAEPEGRVEVLANYSAALSGIVSSLQPRNTQVDLRTSGDRLLSNYDDAVISQGQVRGLAFGLPIIDHYTRGIHPGELAILAAPSKMGKSWALDFVAYQNFLDGKITGLWTLENSIEMTEMRIACIALRISIQDMQNGTLTADEYDRLRTWCEEDLRNGPAPLHIFNPMNTNRTPNAIVSSAIANECAALVVDQLTFVNPLVSTNKNRSRTNEIGEIMREFKSLISIGRHPIPMLMAHQINRDGIKSAIKTGRLAMTDMAESADVERTADWVFGLYASDDQILTNQMQWQTLAARRAPKRDFDLLWDIEIGVIAVRNPIVV